MDYRFNQSWVIEGQEDGKPASVTNARQTAVGRHLAAIGWRHRQAGQIAPTARDAHMVIADTPAGIWLSAGLVMFGYVSAHLGNLAFGL